MESICYSKFPIAFNKDFLVKLINSFNLHREDHAPA